jgi:peptidoglycan/LPS O-acetylase OafA/YrhL
MARLTDRPQPGSPPPPRSPFLPPAPRPQLPPAAPALQQRAAAALVLAALSLITMMLIGNLQRAVYVVAVALVVALVALALAISAMRAAKRAATRRPRAATASVLLGSVGALFSALALAGLLAFWSQYMQYARCLNGAPTVATQNACQQQFKNSVNSRITVLGSD